jgi:hypothetical protein
MMHKNFMHEHKSKIGVPPTHEVLYRLQVSQHQLQKDVTHQLSRFLVNRRDDGMEEFLFAAARYV